MWMDHIVFICLPSGGPLGWFHPMALVNNAGLNLAAQMSARVPAHSQGGLSAPHSRSIFNFLRNRCAGLPGVRSRVWAPDKQFCIVSYFILGRRHELVHDHSASLELLPPAWPAAEHPLSLLSLSERLFHLSKEKLKVVFRMLWRMLVSEVLSLIKGLKMAECKVYFAIILHRLLWKYLTIIEYLLCSWDFINVENEICIVFWR